MLAVLIRNRVAFDTVRSALSTDKVEEIGAAHALIWQAVCDFDDAYEELPSFGQIQAELHNRLKASPDLLDPAGLEEADEFLNYAFDDEHHGRDLARSRSHQRSAVDVCKTFLQETSAMRYQEVVHRDGMVVADLPALLEAHREELSSAAMLTTTRTSALFPPDWDQQASLELYELGVTALDRFLSGGMAGGEVLVFMAPYGTCKTLLGIQLAGNGVLKAADRVASAAVAAGKREVVFLVSTEMGLDEFRIRMLTYLAKVPRKRLASVLGPGKGIRTLSRSTTPGATPETDYEKKLFKGNRADGFQCEYRRVRAAMRALERHLIFLDCTESNPDRPHLAAGGIKEVQNWVKSICRDDKAIVPTLFVLDHASALAQREVAEAKNGYDDIRHILRNIPNECGQRIAKPYKAPFVVLHQLAGEANNRGPGADLHHTDAAECKSFAEFADHAVVCGKPTQDGNQIARWQMTKHRREPPKAHAFVQIIGKYGRVRDVSAKWMIAPGTRTIVSRDTVANTPRHRAQVEGAGRYGHDEGLNG